MHTRSFLVVACLIAGIPVFGQVSEDSLQALYGEQVDGVYTVSPGVTLKTFDGGDGEVCAMTIRGPVTEQELFAIVQKAVPVASRGLDSGGSLMECTGACSATKDYEKMTLHWAVMGGQTSAPAAIVSFKAKSCEQRAKESDAIIFSILQPIM